MDALMSAEGASILETLLAARACKRPLLAVCFHMSLQLIFEVKLLAADFALKIPQVLMVLHVALQPARFSVTLIALVAFVRALCQMNTLMDPQAVAIDEIPTADIADVRS